MMLLAVAVIFCVGITNGANILGIFPHIGYSQYILASTLMKELVNRGHNVTVISAYSQKREVGNFTEILITNYTEAAYRK